MHDVVSVLLAVPDGRCAGKGGRKTSSKAWDQPGHGASDLRAVRYWSGAAIILRPENEDAPRTLPLPAPGQALFCIVL